MTTLAHIAGTVKIDGVPAARTIIVIKDDPLGRAILAEGASEADGTFDIVFPDWTGPVIALAIDKYGFGFPASTPLNLGDVVHPTNPNGYVYHVTDAGTTGATEPAWQIDEAIVSGSVTFAPQPYYRPIASGPLTPGSITVSDPYFAAVKLLLHFNGANNSTSFIDQIGKTVTGSGNVKISTDEFKFGASSVYMDGTGDYLSASHADFAFGSNDFTIEYWCYWLGTKDICHFDFRGGVNNSPRPMIYNDVTGGYTNLYYYVNGAIRITAPAGTLTLNTWQHIAISRAGGLTRMFANGVQVGSTYTDSTVYTAGTVTIGRSSAVTTRDFNGYMDDFRVTNGVARYTANFTPPISQFPDA